MVNLRGGIADDAGNEGSDDLGEADNGEANEGVENDLLGFLDFTGVARGGSVADAAINYEDSGDDAGDTDGPLNSSSNHGARSDTLAGGAVGGEVSGKSDANSIHNDASTHDDGQASEGVNEGLLTGGDFAGVTARENVEIATIDDVT